MATLDAYAIDDIYEIINGPDGYQRIDSETLYVHSRLYPWGERESSLLSPHVLQRPCSGGRYRQI